MEIDKAVDLIQNHSKTVIGHYRAVNERTRQGASAACRHEAKATAELFEALTGHIPTNQIIDFILDV